MKLDNPTAPFCPIPHSLWPFQPGRGNNKCYEGTLQIVNPVNLLSNPEATKVAVEEGRRESGPGWPKHLLCIWPHDELMQTRERALLRGEVFKILSFFDTGSH